MKLISTIFGLFALSLFAFLQTEVAHAQNAPSKDFQVYSVYTSLNMGNPGEKSLKDYYVNMGTMHGLYRGAVLEVYRKTPSYDVINKRLHKDVAFPIARINVIYTDNNSAIARLDKMIPTDETPATTPWAVMAGDFVRLVK